MGFQKQVRREWKGHKNQHTQEEGNNYNETFSLVARLEACRILLVYAAHKNDKPFQMDVKNAFLKEFLNEEVYIHQLENR